MRYSCEQNKQKSCRNSKLAFVEQAQQGIDRRIGHLFHFVEEDHRAGVFLDTPGQEPLLGVLPLAFVTHQIAAALGISSTLSD